MSFKKSKSTILTCFANLPQSLETCVSTNVVFPVFKSIDDIQKQFVVSENHLSVTTNNSFTIFTITIFHHLLLSCWSPFVNLRDVLSPLCSLLCQYHKTTCKSKYLSAPQIWKSSLFNLNQAEWSFWWVYFLPRNSDRRPHTRWQTHSCVHTLPCRALRYPCPTWRWVLST